MKSRLGNSVLVVLGVLYLLVMFAPFFSPYSYDQDDVLNSYSPPTKIHFLNIREQQVGLFIYGHSFEVDDYYRRIYSEDKTKIYPINFFVKGFKYKVLGLLETDRHLFGVREGKVFLLGANLKGRDIFSRVLYGGRISLSIGLIGATISFVIGLLVGGASGYFGGKVDNLLMRLCEMVMMVPSFYLMLA